MASWNARCYLSAHDLSEIDKRFAIALKDDEYMVFWTGVSRSLAQNWARERGLQTLAVAMGPLMDRLNPTSPQNRMNPKKWSKYMKGASGRYAQYACRNKRAIVITNPPPNIYSTRKRSTYRHLEEPILKGAFGGKKVVSISYVHPGFCEAVDFSYQVWPLDQSFRWSEFVQNITITISNVTSSLGARTKHKLSNISEPCQSGTKTLEVYMLAKSKLKPATQNKRDLLQWEALQKKEAKKEAKRQRMLTIEETARQEKEAKKKAKLQRVLAEQETARQQKETKKAAKQQRVLVEQETVRRQKEAKKAAKQQRVLAIEEAARQEKEAKKAAKRQRVLAIEEAARQEKEAKKEAKLQRVLAEQETARQQKETKKAAKRQRVLACLASPSELRSL